MFHALPEGGLTLNDLTVGGGNTAVDEHDGGIHNSAPGTIQIQESALVGNYDLFADSENVLPNCSNDGGTVNVLGEVQIEEPAGGVTIFASPTHRMPRPTWNRSLRPVVGGNWSNSDLGCAAGAESSQ